MNPKFLSKISDLSKTATKLSGKALDTAKKVSSSKMNEYMDSAIKKSEELVESMESKVAQSDSASATNEKPKTNSEKNSSKNQDDEVFL
jgi:hypothetical protein